MTSARSGTTIMNFFTASPGPGGEPAEPYFGFFGRLLMIWSARP